LIGKSLENLQDGIQRGQHNNTKVDITETGCMMESERDDVEILAILYRGDCTTKTSVACAKK
jgi:hypothetical protein